MEPLDGNAIAGELFAAFGREMTTATGICKACTTHVRVAELLVYGQAPGIVVRCPGCDAVVIVLVSTRAELKVHMTAFDFEP